jgi:hypothetical protein
MRLAMDRRRSGLSMIGEEGNRMTRCTLAIRGLLVSLLLGCSATTSDSGRGAGGSSTSSTGGTGGHAGDSNAAGQGGVGGVGVGGGGASGAGTGGEAGGPNAGGAGGASSGGAGGSGGTAGSAGADGGGSDGGAIAGCAGKPYKLCEDFESGMSGAIPTGWTVLRGFSAQRGGVALANDQAHSGRMSLKSDGMNTGMDRVERSLAAIGMTATKHWGRLFYKVASPPPKPNSGVIHLTFAALEGTTENRIVDTVIATNGTHQWLFNIPDDSCCTSSPYNWMFDAAWHCAEWNIDVGTQSFRFFSDGKEVTQLAFTGRAGARMSNYTSIGLGAIFYQVPPMPIVVWFDDLAIDDNQIGCQ